MSWIFDNDKPIYIQFIEQLKIAIACGEYKPGEKLPSVRDLAIQIKANPNTVQRALTELETTNIIYTQRTNGKFVTEDLDLIKSLRQQLAKENLSVFLTSMYKLGLTKDEIVKLIENERNDI